ncbi:MBL fold metallo-hydrolase [Halorubrum sp. Boch-26]|uniref:MBL fold metallo-hydrolase n=1 Tax=Halorubrum sp. Boch-26 TaxID=2994426 RepID=UPI002468654E|nr:MBL fold metallo-hydrolase [Halorubrum sp. Boch-26]
MTKTSEVVPDVYDVTVRETNGGRYRVFVVDGEVPTIVDAGFGDTVDTVVDAVDDLGIDPERIAVTHGDGDHVGGLAGLVDALDLESWVPAECQAALGVEPDHRFEDGDAVGPFEAVHVPGHTEDAYALVDESRDVAVLGDAVFGATARGLPAGHFVLPPGFFSADLNRADESLERLLDYEFEAGLVFHGESVTSGASRKIERFVRFDGRPE